MCAKTDESLVDAPRRVCSEIAIALHSRNAITSRLQFTGLAKTDRFGVGSTGQVVEFEIGRCAFVSNPGIFAL